MKPSMVKAGGRAAFLARRFPLGRAPARLVPQDGPAPVARDDPTSEAFP